MTKGIIMQLNNLTQALEVELADLYDAERQLVQSLPQLARAASSPALKSEIEKHLEETKGHINRLEQVFDIIGHKPEPESCEAMKGLLEEADEVVAAVGDMRVKDAVLIGALQRLEHYEIAGYTTAQAFAEQLDLDDVAELLEENLDEETAVSKRLSHVAEGRLFSSGVINEAGKAGRPSV